MTQGVFSRARFISAAAAGSLLAACGGGGAGVGLKSVLGEKQSSGTARAVRRLDVRSKRTKVAFPQPRPDGSIPPLHRAKARNKKLLQQNNGGDGGGTGGQAGGDTSTADSSYTSSDGYTSYSYDSSNYAEVYDPSGGLDSQMYGYDSSGYSYDFVDSSGDDFSFDMPGLPGDISGNTYAFSVEGGDITVEFSSSADSGKATYQSSVDGKAASATVGPASTSDINFDGTGESLHCQLTRLWQSTLVTAAIMASGLGFRYGPGAAGKAGGGVSAGVIALEQIRVSKEILASQGC